MLRSSTGDAIVDSVFLSPSPAPQAAKETTTRKEVVKQETSKETATPKKEVAEKNAATLAEQKLDEKIEHKIDVELEPVLQELEDLRKYSKQQKEFQELHPQVHQN